MANRHLSRSIVLQTLFEWDFNSYKTNESIDALLRNIAEFADNSADLEFMKSLTTGVIAKVDDLNTIINKAAPEWPIDKISTVDRNVLRMGLYELLFSDRGEVPPKVAINEAIELAKSFGGENSGKFVNGVLGAVYKEIGEPGKDQGLGRKKEIPFEEMPVEKKVGAVVYAKEGHDLYFALVHDVFGHWTLSKGGLEEGESDADGVKRIIKKEIGLTVTGVFDKLGDNEYVANHPEKGKHRKQVLYYLAEANYEDVKLGESGGLDEARWFKISGILDLNFYNDIVPLITKSIQLLMNK
jgi:transcription antitermination protein NusB